MALSFAFDQSKGETPETIKRKRAIVQALMSSQRAPQNLGEGLNALGDGIVANVLGRRADSAEKTGQADANSLFSGINFGSPAYPASVAEGGSPTAPSVTGVPSGVDAAGIKAGLVERGIPEHIADGFLMNFQDESGLNPGINEQNPTVPGSRGGYGLYQLTGPRRVAYENFAKERGVNPADTNAQLDFLVSELKGPEAGAAKSIFAAPDSGSAAAAIAKNFLRPNAKSLAERVAKYTSGGAPVQTASLDPAIGMGANALPGAEQGIGGVAHEQVPPVFLPEQAAVPSASPAVANALASPMGNVGIGQVPAGLGGQPVLDVTQMPQLSVASGIPFQGAPQQSPVASALAQPQTPPAPQQSVSDALLRKNDQALGGIMAPAGTPQPANAALSGKFPPAPTQGAPDQQFPAAPSAPQGGPTAQQLISVINHPYATETQKALALNALKRMQDQSDPATKLDLDIKQAQLKALNTKDTSAEYKEVKGRLFRIDKGTGAVTDVTPGTGNGGTNKFRFDGNSIEGQALNGLMDSNALTEEQAQQIAAGKTITDPTTGAVTFMTPKGIVSQMPGQAPTPVTAPQSAAPAGTPSTGDATGGNPGLIPLTGGKTKALTEGERKNQSLYSVVKPELKVVEDNFGALADPKNQAYAKLPFNEYITTPEYQKATNSLQTIISSYLYSVSGATATPDEVKKQTDILMPRPGESKESIASKKRRVRTMVNAIAKTGGLPEDAGSDLPDGVTEDDVKHTMGIHGLTREQVLEKLNGS